MASEDSYRQSAETTAEAQRQIQLDSDARESKQSSKQSPSSEGAIQAGSTKQPEPPFPKKHLAKPGLESELDPPPRFMASDYKGSGKLQGMAAIVTGGDSGIGRAVAVLFAREGADVAVLYLNEHGDAEETRRCIEKEGRRCLLISGDVRDPAFCNDAVKKTVDTFGKLDVLVNNAAFQEHASSLEEITDEHFDMTIRTNLYGYFNMARAALPHLKTGASIINTGSETGLFGNPVLLDYSATKGAIHAFTKSLAANLMSRGIRVNAVAPGPVWTPLNPADQSPDKIAQFGAHTGMKRPAQPEEVSPAYVFLASPSCASYITGIILPVIGSVG
ncbi:NAD(P)-dependent dehydrogenase (short-subunit alcohol dehydrogenase family) [Paucimonas lemoignei]|uniref:NAD(P)-dependent dehydrogenase (Short-subunit alcohol dehydrogenase family) n=1 Tax=Paucimonas lemoignei TaxID=29443 RepID=A0A4R3I0A1_PAULE|nr:SDR family oxidoreductase [Paucimonas lemoignei]TCS37219.1 NAD(P)-dependent dehydrogenase (short-subunit alcohol dehydrogenase family) [Paucimonas lemoignei]